MAATLRHRARRHLVAVALAAVGWWALGSAPSTGQASRTDLNLVLAIDCSFSVSTIEFILQKKGLAAAFRDPEVLAAIAAGSQGRIAVTVIQWASQRSRIVAVPWMLVDGPATAESLAVTLEDMQRFTIDGSTSISAAIAAGVGALGRSPYVGRRQVIDMQADGTNNNGPFVDDARDAAVVSGIVINGLAILNEVPDLAGYFREHVIGGPGAFVEVTNDYEGFARAMRRKLLREIEPPGVAGSPSGRRDAA